MRQNSIFLNKFNWLGILSLAFILCIVLAACSNEQTKDKTQIIKTYITDEAGLIQNWKRLNNDLASLKDNKGITFVVLTKNELDNTIEQTANDIFEKNKIGEKGKGVLLLISVKEKLYRVEVGRGLEGDLIDYQAKQASDLGASKFKQGKFEEGIRDTITYILKTVKDSQNGN